MKTLEIFSTQAKVLTEKELNSTQGGARIRYVIENKKNILGLPPGVYVLDTETGEMWNILGEKVIG